MIAGIIRLSGFAATLWAGPDRFYSNAERIEFLPLILGFSLLLAIILVVLILPPKRIDQLIDWYFGL